MPSFLNLPAELRSEIYAYIAVPNAAPFSAYRGLYMACHQIKGEIDSEGAKVFGAHLRNIGTMLPGIQIDIPRSFPAMQHIRLVLDINIYSPTREPIFDALQPMFSLHISSLTLAYEELTYPKTKRVYTSFLKWGLHRAKGGDNTEVHARLIILEMPKAPGGFRKMLERIYVDGSYIRKFDDKGLLQVQAPDGLFRWVIDKDGQSSDKVIIENPHS